MREKRVILTYDTEWMKENIMDCWLQTRQQPGAISSLLEAMEWAGLLHDEGPYRQDDDKTTMEEKDEEEGKHLPQRGDFGPYIQSQRLHIYKEEVNKLVEVGQ